MLIISVMIMQSIYVQIGQTVKEEMWCIYTYIL